MAILAFGLHADAAITAIAVRVAGCVKDHVLTAKFVGNLPATIKLPEGEYEIVVQKPGYQRWRRTVAATAGSLMNLTITLIK